MRLPLIHIAQLSYTDIMNNINRGNLIIPAFQRDYAWEEKQIDEMFLDLQEGFKNKQGVLLGNIITITESDKIDYFLLDGQQRIVTMNIIFTILKPLISVNGMLDKVLHTLDRRGITVTGDKLVRENASGGMSKKMFKYLEDKITTEILPQETWDEKDGFLDFLLADVTFIHQSYISFDIDADTKDVLNYL